MRPIDYPRRGRAGWRRFVPSWRLVLGTVVTLGVLGVGAFLVAVAVTPVPPPNDVARAQSSVVYWADGSELGRLGDVNRTDVALSDVPITVQHAVLAAEDRDFFDHGGFSPLGIGRAVWNNVSGGSTQGGSTITQQYAKNAFLTQDRTWQRKVKELVLSVKLETTRSKDEILQDYLNTVYFGRGAYGIEAAARTYFGVASRDLTIAQGAMLASLLKSPEGMSPDRNPDRLKARFTYVLDGMVEKGWLGKNTRNKTVFPKVLPKTPTSRYAGTNGYLLDAVRQDLLAKGIDEAALGVGGLQISTTFDRTAQAAAVAAVQDQAPTEGTKGLRIGLVSVRPGTGEVVALYGGPDYLTQPLNNGTQAIGQAGSTFKPFALAAALEDGVTLDSSWNGDNGRDIAGYRVTNYGDRSWGDISLLQATEQSVNSVYVDVENTVGVDRVMDAATRAGIPADAAGMERNLAFVLGVASPHVIDLASSYATFAARGQQVEPTVLVRVVGPNGGVLWEASPSPRQAFSSDVADSVNAALQSVVTDGTGRTAARLGRPAAGKTGTTNDNMSAWFVGYTPQLSTAVMLVKDGANGQPVSLRGTGGMSSVTGGSFPAAIWTSYMRAALRGQPVQEFVTPAGASVAPSASASPSATTSPSTSTSAPSSESPTPPSPTVPPSDTTSPSAPLPTPPPSPEPPATTAVPEPPPASAAADVPEPRSAASPVSPAAG